MSKETVLNRITQLRIMGDREGAIDMWSKYRTLITDDEFNQAYEKGLRVFMEEHDEG